MSVLRRVSHVGLSISRSLQCWLTLTQEHIVRFVDLFVTPITQMLIMDYYPLGNLHDQASKDPLHIQEVTALLYQGTQAVRYLEEQNIAHRDIKPANILIKSRHPLFGIALADFGLSNESGTTFLDTVCGTPIYAAPEIFDGTGYWTVVDIWSLGVVVLEYFHGLPIYLRHYTGDHWTEKISQVIARLAADEPGDPLICLLHDMLQLDPWERLSAKECLLQASAINTSYHLSKGSKKQRSPPELPSIESWLQDALAVPGEFGSSTAIIPSADIEKHLNAGNLQSRTGIAQRDREVPKDRQIMHEKRKRSSSSRKEVASEHKLTKRQTATTNIVETTERPLSLRDSEIRCEILKYLRQIERNKTLPV